MAYCSVDDIRWNLGIESSEDDYLLLAHINTAKAAIDAYCHRTFEGTVESRFLDAVGNHIRGNVLYVDHVGELASIEKITNGDGVELLPSEYVTIPRNEPPFIGIRIKESSGKRWVRGVDWENAIEIEGVWAFSVTVPEAIRQAAIMLVSFYYRQKDQPFTDVTAIEAGVVMRPVGIPAAIKAILDNGYKKP